MKQIASVFLFLLIACKPKDLDLTAQQIIDKTMHYSGADQVVNSKIKFTFRTKEYTAIRKNGIFELFKQYLTADSLKVKEVLSNNGYLRFINNKAVPIVDSLIADYGNAINSVHYFSVLPFGLNNAAVHKKLLKSAQIKGKEYYKLEISFSEHGGGEDFEDLFIYWIGKESFLIDYLAYSYHTNGGGMRFRAVKTQNKTKGIRFVNYENYKPIDPNIDFYTIDHAFENNGLKKVSEIILEAIEVKL
tara:strand:- start:942 stop:1679 length:738 start_codon:yes stop_codon:yes gene_type:complete